VVSPPPPPNNKKKCPHHPLAPFQGWLQDGSARWQLFPSFLPKGPAAFWGPEPICVRAPAGKVLIPTASFVRTLIAARLAADVCGTPTVLIARTDADSASLLTSDIDPADAPFITGERTPEGFFRFKCGVEVRLALHAPSWLVVRNVHSVHTVDRTGLRLSTPPRALCG
jgi:Isocitrate lyase family